MYSSSQHSPAPARAQVVLRHPVVGNESFHRSGLLLETGNEQQSIISRANEDFESDARDVDLLRSLYCGPTQPCAEWGGVIESSLLMWQRCAGLSAYIEALQCAWFNEIALVSQREQLSFTFVMDTLRLRSIIRPIGRCEYRVGDLAAACTTCPTPPIGKGFGDAGFQRVTGVHRKCALVGSKQCPGLFCRAWQRAEGNNALTG